jgi:2-polyprenyl-3-methyl-5-hydroxy-6-metoxy-1,4-benzoquinol methylase
MNSIATQPKPRCILCGSAGISALSNIADPDGVILESWSFSKCPKPDCGLYWLNPAPLETELWKAYTSYHTHTRDTSGKLGRGFISLFSRVIKLALLPIWLSNGLRQETRYLKFMALKHDPAGKLLDVGCGAGRLLNRMRKLGWEVEGIDFDPQAANKVTTRYGIKTHVGDLVDCKLPDAFFDAITMSQTIEHLAHPDSTLAECLRILKPGGKLIMTTPNVNSIAASEFGVWWRGWEAPRHLHLFSVQTLTHLTQRAGFEIIEARSSSSDSAGVYRVSLYNQTKQLGKVSLPTRLWLLAWGYYRELREYQKQGKLVHTGQNVLVRACKPLH